MPRAARRRYELLVIPDIPNMPARKPLVQAYGVTVGDDVSCAALFSEKHVPEQELEALLINRGRAPDRVLLAWSPVAAGVLHGRVTIDITPEGVGREVLPVPALEAEVAAVGSRE